MFLFDYHLTELPPMALISPYSPPLFFIFLVRPVVKELFFPSLRFFSFFSETSIALSLSLSVHLSACMFVRHSLSPRHPPPSASHPHALLHTYNISELIGQIGGPVPVSLVVGSLSRDDHQVVVVARGRQHVVRNKALKAVGGNGTSC